MSEDVVDLANYKNVVRLDRWGVVCDGRVVDFFTRREYTPDDKEAKEVRQKKRFIESFMGKDWE